MNIIFSLENARGSLNTLQKQTYLRRCMRIRLLLVKRALCTVYVATAQIDSNHSKKKRLCFVNCRRLTYEELLLSRKRVSCVSWMVYCSIVDRVV